MLIIHAALYTVDPIPGLTVSRLRRAPACAGRTGARRCSSAARRLSAPQKGARLTSKAQGYGLGAWLQRTCAARWLLGCARGCVGAQSLSSYDMP